MSKISGDKYFPIFTRIQGLFHDSSAVIEKATHLKRSITAGQKQEELQLQANALKYLMMESFDSFIPPVSIIFALKGDDPPEGLGKVILGYAEKHQEKIDLICTYCLGLGLSEPKWRSAPVHNEPGAQQKQ